MTEIFTDNGHVLLAGITGSKDDCGGKTALANWWLDTWGTTRFDLALFFNAKGTATVRGERVEDIGELRDAMADGHRHINYVPKTSNWEAEHERLQAFVRALPQEMSKVIVHDEGPELGEDSLTYFVRVAGHGANCKSIVIAQAPGDLPTSVRRQCPTTIWIGPTSTQNKHWFRANDYGEHFEFIQSSHDPYQWTVMMGPRPDDRVTYAPVSGDYA